MVASSSLSRRGSAFALAVIALSACSAGPPAPAQALTPAAPPPSGSASAPRPGAAACVIDGTVRGPSGTPVEGALVAAVTAYSPLESAIARTDARGAFCFPGLPLGEYGLTITSSAATSAYVDVLEVDGTRGHGLDVQLGGAGFLLHGKVTLQGGAQAGKQTLHISRISSFLADVFVVETDAGGAYAVRLPPSEYQVKAEIEGAAGAREGLALDRDLDADVVMTPRNPVGRPPPAEVVSWLKQRAIPLATPEAGHGFDDMDPLGAVVGGARLVALGEATHGTREFFQMKHRMLEFLVEKRGFRTFAIEASFPETQAIDAYVRMGKGDPYQAVAAQGFWTWDTEEVVEMVRWMRKYNEDPAHREKLRFLGVDMQSPAGSAQAIADVLGVIDKALWSEVASPLEPIDDDFSAMGFGDLPVAEQEATEVAARKVMARLDEHREADVKKLGAEGWAIARIHAHVLVDFVVMTRKAGVDWGVRDVAMADNALRLLEMLGPAGKMVLWAHNGHVQRLQRASQASMGHRLAERLGKDVVTFGFSFDQGGFQAVDTGGKGSGLTALTLGAAPPGTVDGALALAGLPLFAIDLRTATGAASTWAATPTTQRTIGAVYNPDTPDAFFDTAPPAELFDALFFVARTTAAHATPTGERPDKKRDPLPALGNGGFEDGAATGAPAPWVLNGVPRNFHYRATPIGDRPAGGKRAVRIDREPSDLGNGMVTLNEVIDAVPLRGKHLRLTAQVKLDAKRIGDEAFLYASVDGQKRRSFSAPVLVSRAFREVAVELDVGDDVRRLTIGVAVTGGATAVIDDVAMVAAPRR